MVDFKKSKTDKLLGTKKGKFFVTKVASVRKKLTTICCKCGNIAIKVSLQKDDKTICHSCERKAAKVSAVFRPQVHSRKRKELRKLLPEDVQTDQYPYRMRESYRQLAKENPQLRKFFTFKEEDYEKD